MIKLGDEVKDRISGFKGVAIGRTVYLAGCVQILIGPKKLNKDGERIDNVWFDEGLVVLVKKKKKVVRAKTGSIGGPRGRLNPLPR